MTDPKNLAMVLWITSGLIVLAYAAFFVRIAKRTDLTTQTKVGIAFGAIVLVPLAGAVKADYVWGILVFNTILFALAHVVFRLKSWKRTTLGAATASVLYIALGGMWTA